MKNFCLMFLLAGVMVLFAAGCSEKEPNHPLLKKAAQSMRVGEYRNAELCYKKYLAKHPDSAAVHQALAELCDEHLGDYLLAAYHYKEVLRLSPDMPENQVREIKGFIERCEQRYFNQGRKSKKVVLTDEQEIERLTAAYKKRLADEQKKQEEELARLKKELEESEKEKTPAPVNNDGKDKKAAKQNVAAAEPQKTVADSGVKIETSVTENQSADSTVAEKQPEQKVEASVAEKVNPAAETSEKNIADSAVATEKTAEKAPLKKEIAPSNETAYPKMENIHKADKKQDKIIEYKVKRGDTFTHLSRHFYGSVRYYKKLMEYNKITNPNVLRAGKVLQIPPLEVLKGEKK